jgi:D-alanyl-D-alanine carboxypeptidase (penicillin-binding protein 5/6)
MTNSFSLARRALLAGCAVSGLAGPAMAAPERKAAKRGAKTDPVPTGTPAQTQVGPLDIAARWGIVIDFTTNATLLDKDADLPIPPSSMTKLMTAYIVYDRLKQGSLKLGDELPVSEKAWRMAGSKMFVQLGTSV